jgi:hypothetical protein
MVFETQERVTLTRFRVAFAHSPPFSKSESSLDSFIRAMVILRGLTLPYFFVLNGKATNGSNDQ